MRAFVVSLFFAFFCVCDFMQLFSGVRLLTVRFYCVFTVCVFTVCVCVCGCVFTVCLLCFYCVCVCVRVRVRVCVLTVCRGACIYCVDV